MAASAASCLLSRLGGRGGGALVPALCSRSRNGEAHFSWSLETVVSSQQRPANGTAHGRKTSEQLAWPRGQLTPRLLIAQPPRLSPRDACATCHWQPRASAGPGGAAWDSPAEASGCRGRGYHDCAPPGRATLTRLLWPRSTSGLSCKLVIRRRGQYGGKRRSGRVGFFYAMAVRNPRSDAKLFWMCQCRQWRRLRRRSPPPTRWLQTWVRV